MEVLISFGEEGSLGRRRRGREHVEGKGMVVDGGEEEGEAHFRRAVARAGCLFFFDSSKILSIPLMLMGC